MEGMAETVRKRVRSASECEMYTRFRRAEAVRLRLAGATRWKVAKGWETSCRRKC